MDSVDTVLLVISLLTFCICCPIVIYGLHKYYVRREHFVYQLRYSHITVIQAIIMITKLIYDLFVTITLIFLIEISSTVITIIVVINWYISAFLLYSFVWKFWLLRYNIMLNVYVLNANWKSIINPQETENINSNFYVKYRKTFGNQRFTMIMFTIIAILFTSIYNTTTSMDLFGDQENPYEASLISSWDYIIPYILLIILYFTTPSYEDNFYILKELKYIFVCLFINYTTYYVHLIIFAMIYHPHLSESVQVIADITQNNILLFCQSTAIVISTVWVNKKCNKIIEEKRYKINMSRVISGLELSYQHHVHIEPPELASLSSRDDVDAFNYQYEPSMTASNALQYMLSDTTSYYGFVHHLSSEFCVECLLSLTEFVQYSQYIVETSKHKVDGLDADDNDNPNVLTIQFSSDIPMSYIISNDEWNRKEKAYQLYIKYIKIGSDFEINLSSRQRHAFAKIMDNFNRELFYQNDEIGDQELALLFEKPAYEMLMLMTDAFKRYKQTPQYDKLQILRNK